MIKNNRRTATGAVLVGTSVLCFILATLLFIKSAPAGPSSFSGNATCTNLSNYTHRAEAYQCYNFSNKACSGPSSCPWGEGKCFPHQCWYPCFAIMNESNKTIGIIPLVDGDYNTTIRNYLVCWTVNKKSSNQSSNFEIVPLNFDVDHSRDYGDNDQGQDKNQDQARMLGILILAIALLLFSTGIIMSVCWKRYLCLSKPSESQETMMQINPVYNPHPNFNSNSNPNANNNNSSRPSTLQVQIPTQEEGVMFVVDHKTGHETPVVFAHKRASGGLSATAV